MKKTTIATLAACVMMLGAAPQAEVSFPLSIAESGRYLIDCVNVPFLYKADTGWWLFDKLTEKKHETYLDARKEMGFNTVQVMLAWTYHRPNYYGEQPFLTPCDITTPNAKYWERAVTFVQMAKDRQMLVNFVPLWLGYSGSEWFAVLDKNTPEDCYGFGQYLGELFAGYDNVMWTIGGDHDPQKLYEHENALANGIKEKMPSAIMSAHPWENQLASDQYGEAEWLNLDAVYTYFPQWNNGNQVYTLAERAYSGERPFILIESGYEHASIGDCVRVEGKHLRRQVYWAMLNGACGYAFGNANVWQFTALWKMEMRSEGSQYMKVAGEVLESLPWWNLQPDSLLLTNVEETKTAGKAVAAVTKDRSTAMIYLPDGVGETITLSEDDYPCATWIDPTNGDKQPANALNGAYHIPSLNKAGDSDWILLLTNN